jgi:putative membrane-bound dehydrogenase-like protein
MKLNTLIARSFVMVTVTLLSLAVSQLNGQGYSPAEAAGKMETAAGLEVGLFASEPLVRQPVCIEFDDLGRLWVIQYLQYPNPAGLKRVQVDRYSRTKYDKIPKPPPYGPAGADRISILTDVDGDGQADEIKDFVGGLNLASGMAFGHGGLFVLNVPYLLFYADANRDDIPDGDPEVLLTGFGMEDAHSVANSLTWGPDGWLYGCQGSTVTANVRGIEFQQGVWRYHPITREFELFCEGGGNSWGLDFDAKGQLLYSTNWGGKVMLHGVQGAYLVKSFGKHGALHNPYAFGYFDHVPHDGFRGGHVSVGGLFYNGTTFPGSLRGKYMAGDLLGHGVYWHNLQRRGSTFRSAYAGTLLKGNDSWFAPTDVTLGPDGAIYVTDWHDKRTAHPDPDADWDRTNGRIYRIQAKGTTVPKLVEVHQLPSRELAEISLSAADGWSRRRARRVLAERRDTDLSKELRRIAVESDDDERAMRAVWALYVSGNWDDGVAEKLLEHRDESVRTWAVRFVGDERRVSARITA